MFGDSAEWRSQVSVWWFGSRWPLVRHLAGLFDVVAWLPQPYYMQQQRCVTPPLWPEIRAVRMRRTKNLI